jgi:hypothetical protein
MVIIIIYKKVLYLAFDFRYTRAKNSAHARQQVLIARGVYKVTRDAKQGMNKKLEHGQH